MQFTVAGYVAYAGERWDFRSAPVPTGPNLDEGRYGGGHSGYDPLRRQLLPPQGAFNQPFSERRFNDHYFYEGTARGMKRPYPMEVSTLWPCGPYRER